MDNPADLDAPGTVQCLHEATQWRMLGLLFSRPDPERLGELDALAASTPDPLLRRALAAAERQASTAAYHTIFGPGGPAAPREVSYRRGTFSGRFLAELREIYAAFAYESSASGEAPDHVATLADFVGYLRLKEAYAQSRGEAEQAGLAARAADRIVTEHLAWIAEPLAGALQPLGIEYLSLAAEALFERVGPAPPPTPGPGPDAEAPNPLPACCVQPDTHE